MAERFSAAQALSIAIEIEKRGIEMYRRAARLSASERAIELFKRLEADERNHRDMFSSLYEEYAKDDSTLYQKETNEYLSALASQIVFSNGLIGIGREGGFDNPAAILKTAIDAERDSIIFYEAMLEEGGKNAGLYKEIIEQEKGHLIELTQMLKEELG